MMDGPGLGSMGSLTRFGKVDCGVAGVLAQAPTDDITGAFPPNII